MQRSLVRVVFFALASLPGFVETTTPYLLPFNISTYDSSLQATISVGTPPQSFVFRIDMLASTTYVIDSSMPEGNCCPSVCDNSIYCKFTCFSRCCGSSGGTSPAPGQCSFYFDSHLSTTYVKNGSTLSYVEGFTGIDTFTFGNEAFRVGNFLFGQITTNDADFHLGLGDANNETVLEKMPAIYMIAQQLDVPKLYAVWFNRTRPSGRFLVPLNGEVSFGSINPAKCDTPRYAKLGYLDYGFKLSLQGIQFGSYELKLPKGDSFNTSLPYGDGISFSALTVGSAKILDDMLLAVNGTFQDGIPTVPRDCSALPPLVLTISGEEYRLPPEKFTRTLNEQQCSINVQVAADEWKVGFAFAQEYCLVVDYDGKRLGFAKNMVD